METIAQEAKRILEQIQEEQWTTGVFEDGFGRCCAIGHINTFKSGRSQGSNWETVIREQIRVYLNTLPRIDVPNSIVTVNDGEDPRFPQPTPKQRVMALLSGAIAAGY